MPIRILDQFTERKVSRERRRQLRKNADGSCSVSGCDEAHAISGFCVKHYSLLRAKTRIKLKSKVHYNNTKFSRLLAAV